MTVRGDEKGFRSTVRVLRHLLNALGVLEQITRRADAFAFVRGELQRSLPRYGLHQAHYEPAEHERGVLSPHEAAEHEGGGRG